MTESTGAVALTAPAALKAADAPKSEPAELVTLRLVSSFPVHSFRVPNADDNSYVEVTQAGTDVDAERVDAILEAAARSGVNVEKVDSNGDR